MADVSCALDGGRLHVCVLAADGALWHTVRAVNGSWTVLPTSPAVAGNSPGPFAAAGCAVTTAGVHVVGGTANGRAWITIVGAGGAWTPFTDFGRPPGTRVARAA